MNVLLGVTGSVASILTPKLVGELVAREHTVRIVATETSLYFWNPAEIAVPVLRNKDEWPDSRYVSKSPILHIELRDWADVLLIAPLSAGTLAKIAQGFADNLLTSVARAWNMQKPVVLAPAMNTHMWNHPARQEHLERLTRWIPKLQIIWPVEKTLACGDEGIGAMAPIEAIVEAVAKGGTPCAH